MSAMTSGANEASIELSKVMMQVIKFPHLDRLVTSHYKGTECLILGN